MASAVSAAWTCEPASRPTKERKQQTFMLIASWRKSWCGGAEVGVAPIRRMRDSDFVSGICGFLRRGTDAQRDACVGLVAEFGPRLLSFLQMHGGAFFPRAKVAMCAARQNRGSPLFRPPGRGRIVGVAKKRALFAICHGKYLLELINKLGPEVISAKAILGLQFREPACLEDQRVLLHR